MRKWRYPLLLGSALAALVVLLGGFWAYKQMVLRVSSESMAPTLHEGDIVVAQHLPSCGNVSAQAGDLVLYRIGAINFVHRVVAVGGQRVAFEQGRLIINGSPATRGDGLVGVFMEHLPNGRTYSVQSLMRDGPLDAMAEIVVPDNSYFIAGDNRDNAMDSRVRGPLPAANICAVIEPLAS